MAPGISATDLLCLNQKIAMRSSFGAPTWRCIEGKFESEEGPSPSPSPSRSPYCPSIGGVAIVAMWPLPPEPLGAGPL